MVLHLYNMQILLYWYCANPLDWRTLGWVWGFIPIAGENERTVKKIQCDGPTTRLWWKKTMCGVKLQLCTKRCSFTNFYLRILTAKLAWLEEKMKVALEGWKLLQVRCLGKFLVLLSKTMNCFHFLFIEAGEKNIPLESWEYFFAFLFFFSK